MWLAYFPGLLDLAEDCIELLSVTVPSVHRIRFLRYVTQVEHC